MGRTEGDGNDRGSWVRQRKLGQVEMGSWVRRGKMGETGEDG